MTIEVTYNVTDIYISSEVSPIYIDVNYQTIGGGAAVWGGITGTLSNQTDLQTALNGKFDDPTGTTLQYIDGTGGLQTFPLTLPVLQEVRNQTGATLTAGTVVYISGATGNKPTVSKAIATGDNTSAQTLGMIQSAIANNSTGYVVVIGTCSGLDTSAYTEGQQLYLSYTTAGAVTTTKPYAPNHLVYVGIVTRSHPTLGTIEVRVQNGYEMDELHNVDALNPTNNDGLFYNTTTSLWEHKSIGTVLGYNPEQPLTFSSPLSRLVNAVSIPAATSSVNGYLSSTDWSTFNGKQSALNGTGFVKVTGTTVSYDNSTYYLASNPSGYTSNLGTVTSVAALTLGTTGTDVSSTVATDTTTPVITLNIPTASATNRGALSSTDWSTFNSKQGALTLTTTGTSGAATLVGNTLNIPQYSGGGGMAIGGSITSATAGSVLFAGTSGVLAQNNANFFWDNTNDGLSLRTQGASALRGLFIEQYSTGIQAATITYKKSRGTIASPTNVLANDLVGAFSFSARVGGVFTSDRALFGANMATTTGIGIFLNAGSSDGTYAPSLYIHPTGNVGINPGGSIITGVTDAGFRLDVNGTCRVQGSTTFGTLGTGTGMFWDNTNNRLGIGTGTPSFVLDIAGNTNGLLRQHIKNSSNGTVAQTAILLRNDADLQYMFGITSTGFTPSVGLQQGDAYVQMNNVNAGTYTSSSLVLRTTNDNAIKLQTNSTTRMTIKADGKINISSLPTSSAGLSAGDLWNNGGVINIV